MTEFGQIGPRGEVSGLTGSGGLIVVPPNTLADLVATKVRRTANQNLAASGNVTWQTDAGGGCFSNGAWAGGDPDALTVNAQVGEGYSFGAQISVDVFAGSNATVVFIFNGTGLFYSPGVAFPMGFFGSTNNSPGGTGELQSASLDLVCTQAGTIRCVINLTTEGNFPRVVEAARSRFWVYKLR